MGIEAVRRDALQALRPPPNVPLAEWIESTVRIPASASALPGRMELWPFQRGWCEAIEDPEIERLTIMKGARIGYTQWLSATIASFVANAPAPIIALQPTADDARDYLSNWSRSSRHRPHCVGCCPMMPTKPGAAPCWPDAFRAAA